jgi:hypothetical protein
LKNENTKTQRRKEEKETADDLSFSFLFVSLWLGGGNCLEREGGQPFERRQFTGHHLAS